MPARWSGVEKRPFLDTPRTASLLQHRPRPAPGTDSLKLRAGLAIGDEQVRCTRRSRPAFVFAQVFRLRSFPWLLVSGSGSLERRGSGLRDCPCFVIAAVSLRRRGSADRTQERSETRLFRIHPPKQELAERTCGHLRVVQLRGDRRGIRL